MDYVVFGIGFGATILVLGLLVRDIGPRIRYRTPANEGGVFHAEELVARVSWGRFCSALGAVLALGGLLFLVTTVVCMVLRLSDETGGWVMLGALAFLLVMMAYWTWAFFDRFGSYGILPEREEAPEQEEPAPHGPERPALDEHDVEGEAPSTVAGANVSEPAEFETDEVTAAEEEVATAGSTGEEPHESPAPGDDEPDSGEAGAEVEETEEPPLETPEERLAQMETPIDHGSAEGDLDIAAGGPRRPAPRSRRHVAGTPQEPGGNRSA